MCRILAKSGYRIEHLAETPGISSPNITINGKRADLKRLSSANNILRHAKKATKKQNAELVVFEFDNITAEIRKKIIRLEKYGIHGYYFDSSFQICRF